MLTEAQAAAIQAIVDSGKAKLKSASDAQLKPQTSSSMFGASSGVSSGDTAETKSRSDAVAEAALKSASPAQIIEAWKVANTGGNPDEANRQFIELFSSSRKR
jgi:hypothetical protein